MADTMMDFGNGIRNMVRKKFKVASINYTNECIKKPRCSFCYLRQEDIFAKLKPSPPDSNLDGTMLINEKVLKQAEQIAIAYNGIHFEWLINIIDAAKILSRYVHVTTNPLFVERPHLALLKNHKVIMISLSLDPEKCNITQWLQKARMVRSLKLKVGANILMLDSVYPKIAKIIKMISPLCNQMHLLRPKFYQHKISLEKRKELIWLLKQKYKNLFIDECFRNEFQNKPCRRGKDFISINADGSVSLCSFDIYRENKPNIIKCPYI